jgi:hypothetical protein
VLVRKAVAGLVAGVRARLAAGGADRLRGAMAGCVHGEGWRQEFVWQCGEPLSGLWVETPADHPEHSGIEQGKRPNVVDNGWFLELPFVPHRRPPV